ncbi:hypothetical protein BX611_1933 [Lutibacter oceani]|uniref:Uncharacterized protein n=1 Tax=Lutibacter oceani TaxID=1853311 RepID=A0A3D9RUA5_9FLAO|nr:hypothetical protein [Lutibacter oceani]REE80292.1 hypothetical protein BX611_1933 [Lutibacter oceani]
MNKLNIILFLLLFTVIKSSGQNIINTNVVVLKDFKITMVLESYSCDIHPNKLAYENGNCIVCGKELIRNKKIKFNLIDNTLDLSQLTGRIIVIFKDGTQKVSKLNIEDDFLWVKLGINSLNNFQQAVLKLKNNNKKYKVIFGNQIVHQGHHH